MMTKTLIRQLLLSSILAVGAAGVCAVAGSWAVEVLPGTGDENRFRGESIVYLSDGTPLKMCPVGDSGELEYRDLQGKPVPPPVEKNTWVVPTFLGTHWAPIGRMGSPRLSDGQTPAAYWYLLKDENSKDGAGYFVGFDSQSKQRIGCMGLAGFREKMPPREEWFSGIPFSSEEIRLTSADGLHCLTAQLDNLGQFYNRPIGGSLAAWEVYVPTSDGKLYLTDLQKRTVTLVYDGPAIRSGSLLLQSSDSIRGTTWQIALRTDDEVLILDPKGQIRHRFAIPPALKNEHFQAGVTLEGEAVLQWSGPYDSLTTTTDIRLFRLHKDGQSDETSLTLSHGAIGHKFQVYGGLAIPSPIILASAIGCDRVSELVRNQSLTIGRAVKKAATEYWPTVLLALGISMVLCGLTYRKLARYGASRTERIIWPLFVLLLGLPGWIGHRFGRAWPVLEACPGCSTRTPRDRDDCAACGEEFLAPAELGTEVYA